ncbi:MAG: MFS transporter [Synergistes sp.]|nr:MFS transporter [Synergistes sp.]
MKQLKTAHSGPQGKKTRIFLLAMAFFLNFGFANVCFLLPLYYAHTGFTSSEAGILLSAFYIAALVFRLILGGLLPRFGFGKFLMMGGVFSVLGAVGTAVSGGNFAAAIVSRVIFGIGSTFTQVALATFQSLAFEKNERGAAFSFIMAGGLATTMTVFPIADWCLAKGYFNAYIMINVFITVALVYVTVFALKTDDVTIPTRQTNEMYSVDCGQTSEKGNSILSAVKHGLAQPFIGLGECFKNPKIVFAFFMMFMFSLVDAASCFMSPMLAAFGLMMSFFISTNAAVGVFIRLTMGKALDKLPREKLSVPVTVTLALILLLATIHPTRTSLMALGFVFGILMGFGYPLHLALVSDSAPRTLQAQAVSFGWFLSALDFTIVPLLFSFIGELTDPVFAFRAVTISVLLCCAAAQIVRIRARKG